MSNKIGIDVGITPPDTSAVVNTLNQLGQKIAQANKVQFSPVSKVGLADMATMQQRMKELINLSASLRNRMKATGQENTAFQDLDWDRMHPNPSSRNRSMLNAFQHVVGNQFSPLAAGGGGGAGGGGNGGGAAPAAPGGPKGPSWGGVGMQVAQSGLRAAGPAGGVAANALGAGASSGFGAGLMGLVGGIAALGVGKLISAVTEKVEAAEQNAIDMDKLKRTMGDVNVAFGTLTAAVQGSAKNLKITYAEAGKLGLEFVKQANLPGSDMKSLPAELATGVGLSRSFGLDPSQGVGVIGQMRGLGVTNNTQDSRRFALLIGETIGKSNAFAKADEVIAQIGSYAVSQTRSGLSAANVAGYAGTYSGLLGSGIPGLDASGAASLLSRVNASISAGGAHGEASQYFTGGIGASLGLNPYETRAFRENGAFGTLNQTFGKGSVYERYTGKTKGGPNGDRTMLSLQLDKLRSQYGNGTMEAAEATANQLGIGVNQAMGLLSVNPNQMGQMQGYAGDLTKLNAGGIGNLSKALYGSTDDRKALAADFLGRRGNNAITKSDADAIRGAGGNDDKLKEVLATVASKYDQESTQGSDIRDSKNTLDNIKTSLAEKLVPLAQGMRDGIMFLAGDKGKISPLEIQKGVLDSESEYRTKNIKADYDARAKVSVGAAVDASQAADKAYKDAQNKIATGVHDMTVPQREAAFKNLLALEADKKKKNAAVEEAITAAREATAKAVKEEADYHEKTVEDLKKAYAASIAPAPSDVAGDGRGFTADGGRTGGGRGGSYDALGGGGRRQVGGGGPAGDVGGAMKFFMDKGWTREQAAGIVANLSAESGLRPGAVGDNGQAFGVGQWHPDRQANFAKWAGHDLNKSTQLEQYGFVNYELTEGGEQRAGRNLRNATTARAAAKIFGEQDERYGDRSGFTTDHRGNLADQIQGTPLPAGLGANQPGAGGANITADDITVHVVNEKGKPIAPPSIIQTKVKPTWAAGNPGGPR